MPHIKEDIYHNMLQYNWPGNIRELENFIENIVNLRGDSSFMLEEDFKILRISIIFMKII